VAPVPVDFENVPVRLDWNAFSTRSFPGSRRHDLQTISAYGAYSRGREAAGEHGRG